MGAPSSKLRSILEALAAGIVLVAASLVLRQALSTQTPFELLADAVTRALPPRLLDAILGQLEYWAKPALLIGLAMAWLVVGAGAAGGVRILARRLDGPQDSPRLRRALAWSAGPAILLWLLGALVVSPASGGGFLGASLAHGGLPYSGALAGASVAFAAVTAATMLGRCPPRRNQPRPAGGPSMDRRQFLLWGGTAALTVVGGLVLARNVRDLLANARGAALAATAEGLASEVTPNGQFYVVSKNFTDPAVAPEEWRVRIEGLVEDPVTITLSELKSLPAVRDYVTLECISNKVGGGLISNALWTGASLGQVLRRARLAASAAHLRTFAADGYTESLPLEAETLEAAFLAYEMNGEPLPHKHGAPVRLLVPGRYGMKSTKWLEKIEVTAEEKPGYWENRGWDNAAVVKTTARIDVPRSASEWPAGPLTIGGVAFAGSRGIASVEVSTDDGATWSQARLRPALSRHTWVLWTRPWEPPGPGVYRIQARAVDGTGAPQVAQPSAGTFPDGATGYHTVVVRLV